MVQKNKLYILLFVIIIIGFILRIMTITTYSIWFDEAYSALGSQVSLKDLLFSNPEYDVHPFGFLLIGHFFIDVLGNSPYILRYMTVLISIITMLTMFFVTKKFYNENVALLTTFLFATSLTMIKYSQESRQYIVLILLSILSFHFLKEQKWLWFVLVTASMEYFHYYAVFIIIAHVALVYALRIDWKKFVKAQFFVYVLMIPVVIYFVFQNFGTQGLWLVRPLPMSVPSAFLFQLFIAGNTAFSNVHSVFPFLCFGVLMCFLFLQRFGRLEVGMLLAWFFGITTFLLLAYSPLALPYHHRFALMFCPLLYILLARGIVGALSNWKALGIGLICVWLAVQGFMYYQYYSVPDTELAHAASFLKPYCLNHSIVLHESPFSLLPLKVYEPACVHILETDITLNQLRTAGGAVIEPRVINNASLIPDYYVLSEIRSFPMYAAGRLVFNESNLLIIKVDKSSYRFREYNVSRDVDSLNLTQIFRKI